MTKVYLIRHAEAEGNLYRRVHGHYDSDLTLAGEKMVEMLAERFEDIHIDAVYSSNLRRAMQTAKAVYLPKNLPLETHPDLREYNLGDWEDCEWGYLAYEGSEAFLNWENNHYKCKVPGGDDVYTVSARMTKKILELAEKHKDRSIAIFSHGAAIRSALCAFMGIDFENIESIGWADNTAVALLLVEGDKVIVEYKNDASHLESHKRAPVHKRWWEEGFDRDSFNLWFRPVDPLADRELIKKYQRDAFFTVWGSLRMFDHKQAFEKTGTMLAFNPKSVVFAMQKSVPIGIIELDVNNLDYDNNGHIALFYLVEQARGMGFGAQLLGYAISFYRSLGRKSLTLRVAVTNTPALAFYKKHGFYQIDIEDSPMQQILVMRKEI